MIQCFIWAVYSINKAATCFKLCGHFTSGPWSAFRTWFPGNAGFGKLRIVNSTHVFWEQIKAWDASIEDSIWIAQEHHGPFKPLDVEY